MGYMKEMTHDVTRFAPSPTGFLHAGHAASALFAARHGQSFLLRVEDIDATRCKPEFEAAIYEDLAWLGLSWPQPVRRQSEHMPYYASVLQGLKAQGLLYACTCTRADIARAGGAPQGDHGPVYPGTCRHKSFTDVGQPYALRLDVQKAAATVAGTVNGPLKWFDRAQGWQQVQPESFGDIVLARKETPASYHLCVTVDDALQGVTLVTRGQDLFDSTPIHRLLQAVLGLPVPDYLHHPLLVDESGKRLAKRDNAKPLREMRAEGVQAAEIIEKFGRI